MVQAIEENSVRRGYDPRDFTLVAFGGGGPLYACDIAQELEIPQVVVPPHPGITSAMGLLATNVAYDYVKTEMEPLHEADPDRLEADFAELEAQAAAQLERDGFSGDSALLERSADCRYVGQGYELRIPLPPGPVDAAWLERARETFHEQHERRYYRRYDEAPIQLVNIHSVGVGTLPELALAPVPQAESAEPAEALTGEADVTFVVRGEPQRLRTSHYDRALLKAGHEVAGPAIVHQFDSTTVVNPGLVARVDAVGNLLIDCSTVRDTGHHVARGGRRHGRRAGVRARPGDATSDRRRVQRGRPRDGADGDAHVLLEHHPRVGGPRRGPLRRRRRGALRERHDAAASRPACRGASAESSSACERRGKRSRTATSSSTTTRTTAPRTAPT